MKGRTRRSPNKAKETEGKKKTKRLKKNKKKRDRKILSKEPHAQRGMSLSKLVKRAEYLY